MLNIFSELTFNYSTYVNHLDKKVIIVDSILSHSIFIYTDAFSIKFDNLSFTFTRR